tara:strand:+ start:105 stop:692 length:588 start_codon:yes stop_codon:yes gene_type:complete
MTTTITIPNSIKNCIGSNEHSVRAVSTATVSYNSTDGGSILATTGHSMISIKDLPGDGETVSKRIMRDSFNNRKQGSRIKLESNAPLVEGAAGKWSVGEYADEDIKSVPYADVFSFPDESDVIHSVTLDAAKLFEVASALKNGTSQVTLYFTKNKPIAIDGGIGVGILMPCQDATTYKKSSERFADHRKTIIETT